MTKQINKSNVQFTDTTTTKVVKRDPDNVTLRKDFIRCWLHANPTVKREQASRLYDALQERFPNMTRGGHRGMALRLKPWETLVHECPRCAKRSQGMQQIEKDFGHRVVPWQTKSGRKSKVYFQSHCRKCRHIKDGTGSGKRINPEVQKFYTNGSDAIQPEHV